MKFSVIIPTINRIDLVETCIKSLIEFEPDRSRYEIIVIDDASSEESKQTLKSLSRTFDFKVIFKPENQGFPSAVNTGLNSAQGRYAILCNNDIVFTEPVLDKFESTHLEKDKVAVVGCKLFYPSGAIQHSGVDLDGYSFNHSVNDGSRYCIALTFALCSIRMDYVKKYGGLNTKYFIACDDSDYCVKAWLNGFEVYYNKDIKAIHLEGETRGRNSDEKLVKFPKAYHEEKKSLRTLGEFLDQIDLHGLNKMVKLKNTNKLEVGCGNNPQEGYLHLDIRPGKHIDFICDFSKDRLPFKDNTLSEILSNHSIEHVSFRQLPHVLGEWNRVLKPGGKVFFRTPDLEFICRTYLAGLMTPEHPNDESFIDKHFGQMTPTWWANIKLFAGQDYDSNFHYFCWDFKTAKECLERYGFENVKRLYLDKVYSPGELQIEAWKKS